MERVLRSTAKMLTVLSAAALFTACSGGSKQLSRTDVQLAAGDLRTFAASAHMLVEQCSAERATETFCRQQSELLSSKVEDALRELNGHGGPAELERNQLEDIGIQVRDIVFRCEQLSNAPADASDAERLSLLAKSLEESLRK
jgi:hypothetical protein